jgi:predicted transcriptional regulator
MNVILSIKPKFAEAIFSGKKEVEFRKSLFKQDVDKVFVYSTAPVQQIVGYFTIAYIIENSPEQLWQQFGEFGYIKEEEFFKYFRNTQRGYSICIATASKLDRSIDPHMLIEGFTPPQSFRYYDGDIESTSHGCTVFTFPAFAGKMNRENDLSPFISEFLDSLETDKQGQLKAPFFHPPKNPVPLALTQSPPLPAGTNPS